MNLAPTIAALTAAGYRFELCQNGPTEPPALLIRAEFTREPDRLDWKHQIEAIALDELAAAQLPDQTVAQTLWRLAWALDRPAAGEAAKQFGE